MTNSDLANKLIKDDGWLGWLAQAGRWGIYLVSVGEDSPKKWCHTESLDQKEKKRKRINTQDPTKNMLPGPESTYQTQISLRPPSLGATLHLHLKSHSQFST